MRQNTKWLQNIFRSRTISRQKLALHWSFLCVQLAMPDMPDYSDFEQQLLRTKTAGKTSLAIFTLEDKQIVWMEKSSQTNKSSDVRLMCKRDKEIFRRTNHLIFVCLERLFFPDDLPVETKKSMTVQHKFTSDGPMPHDLSVQTICSSSSVKTATVRAVIFTNNSGHCNKLSKLPIAGRSDMKVDFPAISEKSLTVPS